MVKRALCLLQIMIKVRLKDFCKLRTTGVFAQPLQNQICRRQIYTGHVLLEFTHLEEAITAFRPGKNAEDLLKDLLAQNIVQLVRREQSHLDQSHAVTLALRLDSLEGFS